MGRFVSPEEKFGNATLMPLENDNTAPAPRHTEASPAIVTADSARGGPEGGRVLRVLIVVTVAAVVVIGLYFAIWSATIGP